MSCAYELFLPMLADTCDISKMRYSDRTHFPRGFFSNEEIASDVRKAIDAQSPKVFEAVMSKMCNVVSVHDITACEEMLDLLRQLDVEIDAPVTTEDGNLEIIGYTTRLLIQLNHLPSVYMDWCRMHLVDQ